MTKDQSKSIMDRDMDMDMDMNMKVEAEGFKAPTSPVFVLHSITE
jgi:hypothetical protein